MDKALEAGALSERELQRLTAIAMRAFEPLSSVLRYREVDKWHSCDVMGMRDAVKAIFAELRPAALPATDTSGLVERLRERASSYRAGGPSSEHTAAMLDEAADYIEALERESSDEFFFRKLKNDYERHDMAAAAHGLSGRLREMDKRAKAANKAREKAEARLAEAEALLGAFLNCEYESRRDLNDCIDNSGVPYQSQYLADRIADTERFLTPAPTSKGGSDGRS